MSATGVVDAITQDWQGDTLDAAASAGATLLSVFDAGDFSEDADTVTRYLLVGGESTPRQYVGVDKDTDTVTLAATVGGSGLEAGLPVVLWDPTVGGVGAQAVEYVATVTLDDGSGSPDAVIPHDLIPTTGVDGLLGATVSIDQEDDDDDWYVAHVLGREPTLSADYIVPGSEGKWVSDGEVPTVASVVTVRGGIGSLAVTWIEVPNQDPVTYRLHVAAGVDPATDGTMEVAAGVGVTAALVRTLADGTPVVADGSVTYHAIVSVEDADGRGPDSTPATGTPAQVTSPDLAVDAVTANHLLANDAFIGALQAVDFSAVTITGPTIQTEPAEGRGIKLGYDPDGGAYLRAWASSGGSPFFDVTPNKGLVIVAGEATLEQMASGAASLGGATDVASGGTVTLRTGATAPTSKPTVGSTYDAVQFTQDGGWGNRRGWAWDGTYYYAVNESTRHLERWDTSGSLVATSASAMVGDTTTAIHGCSATCGGGKVYVGLLDANDNMRVYRFSSSMAVESSYGITADAVYDFGKYPAVGYDQTSGATDPLLIGQARASGTVRVTRATFTGPTVTTGANLDTFSVGAFNMGSLLYAQDVAGVGGFDFTAGGPSRYLFAKVTGTSLYCANGSTGARRPTDEFSLGVSDKVGVIWNGSVFKSMDRDGVLRTYTTLDKEVDQTSVTTTKWVSASYFRDNVGTDWETFQSPKTKIVQFPKRSKMTVTGPALAASPGANDPNAVQFYAGSGSSEPATSAMWQQTWPGTGVNTAVYSSLTTSGTAHPNAGTAFPTSGPSVLASDALASDAAAKSWLDSTGAGRLLKLMQAGTVSVVVSGGIGTQAVTYSEPFDANPSVTFAIVDGTPTTDFIGLSAASAGGFTVSVQSGTNATYTLHWIAMARTQ